MFVQNLNQKQQAALLHYADAVMRADGEIDPKELVAMQVLHSQVQEGIKAEEVEISELPRIFKRKLSRVSFLLELAGMAYIDDEYEQREAKLVTDIAKVFDLQDCGTMAAIEQWVTDQFLMLKQAKNLMEE
ncbi:MAG: hypothetical protein OXD38_05630 [Aestuariivita sp.]|nr:hypothetical protein [Aestuariivita sp.]